MKKYSLYFLILFIFFFCLFFSKNIRERLSVPSINFLQTGIGSSMNPLEVSPQTLQTLDTLVKKDCSNSSRLEYYPRLLPSSVPFLDTNVVIQTKMELRKMFSLLSSSKEEQRRIKNITKTEYYIPPTTDFLLQKQLHIFTNMILETLNRHGDYDFQFFNYDRILILTGKEDEKNYIYDVLVQENNKVYQLKLRIDVYVKLDKEVQNNILTCAKETTPEFPTYPIGIPSNDQLIPLPTEVSITSKQVYSVRGINVLRPREVKELYINHIGIFNSELVLDPELPTKNYGGTTDGTLENKKVELANYLPVQEEGKVYNRWITLPDQPTWLRSYPCAPPNLNWNDLGIYKDIKTKFPCEGVRWSTVPEPVQADYYPTLAALPRNMGENYWLFDLSTGIPSFPTGHATGGR
jgi:hypothetical protein